jgi:hypothetical protein
MQENAFTAKLTVTDDIGNTGYAYKKIEGYIYNPVADFVASTYNGKTGSRNSVFWRVII